MSTADIQARDGHAQQRTGRRTRRRARRGFSLDMTPLVDVAFLLLTFFMFATTMAQPQAMEMRLPTGCVLPLTERLPLEVYVRGDGRLFARKASDGVMKRVDRREAKAIVAEHYRTEGAMVTLKVDTVARYQRLVDMIDDVRRAGRREARGDDVMGGGREGGFSVQRMTPQDYREVGTP